jgi:hypothetical protein
MGGELLAADLILVLTRREEFGFIPSYKKLFFRIIPVARDQLDANNGSAKRQLLPADSHLLRTITS